MEKEYQNDRYIDLVLGKSGKRKNQEEKLTICLMGVATDLYNELESKQFICRIQELNQLGPIRVLKRHQKSRLDYMKLQLYLHQIIKGSKMRLEYTYGSNLESSNLPSSSPLAKEKFKTSVSIALQVFTIAYNIGHFFNTFTASRAVLMAARTNPEFRKNLLKSSADPRFHPLVEEMLNQYDYKKIHLVNSILVLEELDQSIRGVRLAKELIYAYLEPEQLPEGSKFQVVFDYFRKVRDVSYIAFDMAIAETPFEIDLRNEAALINFFKELMDVHNDHAFAENLIESMDKLLDDVLYNESRNAICHFKMSQSMVRKLGSETGDYDYYEDLWLNKGSIFNQKYPASADFGSDMVLKLTFSEDEKVQAIDLYDRLQRKNHVRCGFYERRHGEWTILLALTKDCDNKAGAAFLVLKLVTSFLRDQNASPKDLRYLITTVFFLYFYFNDHYVRIDPIVDDKTVLLFSRGHRRKAELVDKLPKGHMSEDAKAEVKFLRSRLEEDKISDGSIIIPASVKVLDGEKGQLCEIDGMIIHPYRTSEQIILLEAKNIHKKPGTARKCLREKLKKLEIPFNENDFNMTGTNCSIARSIR